MLAFFCSEDVYDMDIKLFFNSNNYKKSCKKCIQGLQVTVKKILQLKGLISGAAKNGFELTH